MIDNELPAEIAGVPGFLGAAAAATAAAAAAAAAAPAAATGPHPRGSPR